MKSMPAPVVERMVALRRDLHQHPELSWKEERTAERIEAHLAELGIPSRRMAGTGVVADLPGEGGRTEPPFVALRADTDALPILEKTGLPFASVHEGVMHACGHDAHTSMTMGAAALLQRDPAPTPVRLIWQPAEEEGEGAQAMVEEGVLDGVGMIFGGHVDRRYQAGVLVVTDGAVNASSDTFRIVIEGRGGHGARPHEATDAIVVASLLVMAIQTIVSREVDPSHPAVVTVGALHAGTANNVIAATATLEGTIRAQEPIVRETLTTALARIAKAIGELHGARITTDIRRGMPAVRNLPGPTALARKAAVAVAGEQNVTELDIANMGGEDFSYFLEKVPGCYIRIGATVPGREGYPAHSDRFDVDEDALGVAAAYYHRIAHVAGAHLLEARG